MALTAGSAAAGTGLARAIYDALEGKFGAFGDLDRNPVYDVCDALADAVVSYFKTNADVKITSSDDGLQRDSTGADTSAPLTTKTLSGALD